MFTNRTISIIISTIVILILSIPAFADNKSALIKTVTADSWWGQNKKPGQFMPHNLFDKKSSTAWCEWAKGDGVGQTVTVQFAKTTEVSLLKITNGFAASLKKSKQNQQVKTLRVFFYKKSKEVAKTNVKLKKVKFKGGKAKPQTVKLKNSAPADTIKFVIKAVHKNQGDSSKDTCMSGIKFGKSGMFGNTWYKHKGNYSKEAKKLLAFKPAPAQSKKDKALEKEVAGRGYMDAPGFGQIGARFCANNHYDRHDDQPDGTYIKEKGTWKVQGNQVQLTITFQEKTIGVGATTTGARGPVYQKFKTQTKTNKEVRYIKLSEFKSGGKYSRDVGC